MKIDDYTVNINGRDDADGYVEMEHKEEYSINLVSDSSEACDAEITVDGTVVGQFRLNSMQSIFIERPANCSRKFTFLSVGSYSGAKMAGSVNPEKRGLISVIFKPKIVKVTRSFYNSPTIKNNVTPFFNEGSHNFTKCCSAGVTGLGKPSQQVFKDVEALITDRQDWVTINLRLVNIEDNYIPLKTTPKSNPVPRPIQ